MEVRVRYFGQIADLLSVSEENIHLVVERPLNVREFLESRYPSLQESTYQIAINNEFGETIVPSDKVFEISLLPPFAGG